MTIKENTQFKLVPFSSSFPSAKQKVKLTYDEDGMVFPLLANPNTSP